MEIRKDLYDFVLETLIDEGNTKEQSLLMMSTINENWLSGMQNASKMFRIMTGIDKIPVKPPSGPVNLTNIFKGTSTPPVKQKPFQLGSPNPKPLPVSSKVEKPKLSGTQKGGLIGLAAAIMAPRPTADGTLDAAKKRGDLDKKGSTDWIDPMPTPEILKRSGVSPKQEVKPAQTGEKPKSTVSPVVKKPTPAKPVDPDAADKAKYSEARLKGEDEAEKVGMEIWNKKFKDKLPTKPQGINPALERFKSM